MKKLIIIFLLLVLFIPAITKAAGLVPCGGPEPEKPCTACDLLVLAENVLHYALTLAFTIVVIFAIIAGFRLIFSGGNEVNIKAAQKSLSTALIGLAIILCSYLIVNTVFWLMAQIGGDDYTNDWWHLECTYPESKTDNDGDNGNGGGDGGGNGGDGGGTTENWCSDMAGYACVNDIYGNGVWNANCDSATVVVPNPYSHCPDGTICCIPADELKIIAQPKNPEPPDQGGPCDGGGLMVYCANYTVCRTVKNCDTQQWTTYCAVGNNHLCPPCPNECDPSDPNACK